MYILGLQLAIKYKNSDGEYESKAVSNLDGDGGFSVPLAADDLHGAECFVQLHSATSRTACPRCTFLLVFRPRLVLRLIELKDSLNEMKSKFNSIVNGLL
uniref:Uncharacterized protein n=1 Tax=Oryza brachyantha TaxID=4533 RepID=J3LEY7_ORYBR